MGAVGLEGSQQNRFTSVACALAPLGVGHLVRGTQSMSCISICYLGAEK